MNKVEMIQGQALQQPEVGSIWTDDEGGFYILTLTRGMYCLTSLNNGEAWGGMYSTPNDLLLGEPLEMVPVGSKIEIVVGG